MTVILPQGKISWGTFLGHNSSQTQSKSEISVMNLVEMYEKLNLATDSFVTKK